MKKYSKKETGDEDTVEMWVGRPTGQRLVGAWSGQGGATGRNGRALCSVINAMKISGSLGRVAADVIFSRAGRDHQAGDDL